MVTESLNILQDRRNAPDLMEPSTSVPQQVESKNPIKELALAIERVAHKQLTALFKPTSSGSLIFNGTNEKFKLFEDLYHTMLKMQPPHDRRNEIYSFPCPFAR